MGIINSVFEKHGMPPTRMSNVVRLADYKNANRRIQPDICFNKKEFDQLLSVYSRRVMSGEWKDYAIRHDPTMAAFLIYRNNSRQPSFTVIKRKTSGSKLEYLVYHGRERLKRSASLTDALSVLKRKLKLVSK
ncbi:MAG: DUF2794 domain-containing protein [Alphaproteobacteria bacterium]|jgi:hypothetical protein|nr:DUF2794 domain-containing protein [Alphaproteobacteria bacterium]